MAVSELAGRPAERSLLVDVDRLVGAYYDRHPDVAVPSERVAFGTSGHRGSSLTTSFNEGHILATSAAICQYRRRAGITGPLFLGRDTHALSGPAFRTAIEVLVADGVHVLVDSGDGYTPTPALSHAILVHNRDRQDGLADGIVVTPSHNPPADGGFKYNPPTGGPADSAITGAIEHEANTILAGGPVDGLASVRREPYERARGLLGTYDFMGTYVADLGSVVDMDAIRTSGLHLGVDPLGGASVAYWGVIAERYGLDLTVTNDRVDPQFAFMTVDWDGKIRMDPSSPYAMASLVGLRDQFDLAFANDTDADRHGSSRGAPASSTRTTFSRRRSSTCSAAGATGRTRSRSARRSSRRACSTGSSPRSEGASWRFRSASSGSSTGCSTGASGSAARRARAHPSCAATDPSGQPTRTG
jgi:phosphoglucomutase